jgi:hypothetical protein
MHEDGVISPFVTVEIWIDKSLVYLKFYFLATYLSMIKKQVLPFIN